MSTTIIQTILLGLLGLFQMQSGSLELVIYRDL